MDRVFVGPYSTVEANKPPAALLPTHPAALRARYSPRTTHQASSNTPLKNQSTTDNGSARLNGLAMKAVRGLFVLALGLIPLLPHLTSADASTSSTTLQSGPDGSSSTKGDGIPQVGLVAVHPICDPLTSEFQCISSDEQVQDELNAVLQADEQVIIYYR